MNSVPRVAVFADSSEETSGAARATNALAAYAARHHRPMLIVRPGKTTRIFKEGSIVHLELQRCPVSSFSVEQHFRFDLAMWQHAWKVARVLRGFRASVVHFTGPGDIGLMGAHLGQRLGIPSVASWHANLHEYFSRRLRNRLGWLGRAAQAQLSAAIEQQVLRLELFFYNRASVVLTPSRELLGLLARRLDRPAFIVAPGVDTDLFSPHKRSRRDPVLNIGYVGRLSPEMNVRALAAVDRPVACNGYRNLRFTIVGEGSERTWLSRQMRRAEFPGVLRGEPLAAAYANMDIFALPSGIETSRDIMLEAMASGLPVVAMAGRGSRSIDENGRAVTLARDEAEFSAAVRGLAADAVRRREMSASARALACGRSWERTFDDVYRAYGEALSRTPSSRRGRQGRAVTVVHRSLSR